MSPPSQQSTPLTKVVGPGISPHQEHGELITQAQYQIPKPRKIQHRKSKVLLQTRAHTLFSDENGQVKCIICEDYHYEINYCECCSIKICKKCKKKQLSGTTTCNNFPPFIFDESFSVSEDEDHDPADGGQSPYPTISTSKKEINKPVIDPEELLSGPFWNHDSMPPPQFQQYPSHYHSSFQDTDEDFSHRLSESWPPDQYDFDGCSDDEWPENW